MLKQWLFVCGLLSIVHCIQRSCSIDLDTYNYDSETSNSAYLWLVAFYTERSENISKFLEDWSNKGAIYCDIEDKLPVNITCSDSYCDNIKRFAPEKTTKVKLGLVNMYSLI